VFFFVLFIGIESKIQIVSNEVGIIDDLGMIVYVIGDEWHG